MKRIRIGEIRNSLLFDDELFRTIRRIKIFGYGINGAFLFAGGNSVTYKVEIDGKIYAMKCYTTLDPSRQEIHKVVSTLNTPILITPRYFVDELWVKDCYTDVALYPWIEGVTLTHAMRGAVHNKRADRLTELFEEFVRLALQLHNSEWRHGDLKTDNIIVCCDGSMMLIDCDMLIHSTLPQRAVKGTPRYIHPQRPDVADIHADDYPTACIATSLAALAADLSLLTGEPVVSLPSEGKYNTIRQLLSHNSALIALLDAIHSPDYKIDNITTLLKQCTTHP